MSADHFPTFRKLGGWLNAPRSRPPRRVRQRKAWFPTFSAWLFTLVGRRNATATQRRALLRLIEVAAEERISLAPLVDAWACEEPFTQHKRLKKLSQTLADGLPVADAVERFPSLLSDEEILLVRFAGESGTLAPTLHHYLNSSTDDTRAIGDNLRRAKNYLLMMLLIGVPVTLWTLFYISPELEKINDYFSISPTFRVFTEIQYDVVHRLISIGLVVLAILAISRWAIGPWRSLRRRVAPLLLGSVRSLRTSQVLRRLSESSATGRPLAGAVSTLARNHYDPAIRHKLLYARNELALGAELWSSFRSVGLLSAAELRALEASDRLETNDRPGLTAWTLAALAAVRERRAIRRQTWLSMALSLAAVLLFGAFVLLQAVSMITFLSELITQTS